ncbi:hypothetical protein MBR_00973, partial [Metarhizium brunneum ARSEF 3297]
MGNNLSSTFVPDTSKVVLSPPDAFGDILVVIIWGLVLIRVGGGSVLAAMLLSTAWPVVMAYIVISG